MSVVERSPFGLQKDYIWEAKGVLLEGKRATFVMQKESFFTELCKWLIFKRYFNGNQSLSFN